MLRNEDTKNPLSDDEVGLVCERLNEHADCIAYGGCAEHQFDSGSKLMREAAALLQSQVAELAAVKAMYAREGAKAMHEAERAERAEAALAEKDKALERNALAGLIRVGHFRAARRAHSKDGGSMSEPCEWLIRKGGYYYRPNRSGYTTRKIEAGRYTKAEADREASVEPWHMSAIHQDEVPDEPAVVDLSETIASLQAEVERLTRERDRWEKAYHEANKDAFRIAGERDHAKALAKLREGGEPVPVEYMVQRFLQWKLPIDFSPDGGIQFVKQTDYGHVFEPVGTNLLDYTQAKAMVLHMLDGAAIATTEQTDARSGVRVRELEWWVANSGDIIADSIVGRYRLGKVAANANFRLETPDGLIEKPSPEYYWPEAEAKAAAQADYERRILSALSPAAPDPTPVDDDISRTYEDHEPAAPVSFDDVFLSDGESLHVPEGQQEARHPLEVYAILALEGK